MAGVGAMALTACGQEHGAEQIAANTAISSGPDPFAGAQLMADVESYVGFGAHRTGSSGDLATSQWFAKHWRELGYEVEQTEFSVPNADTTVARLEGGMEAFDGFAQPLLSFTPDAGVTAPLAVWNPESPANVAGKIALVHFVRAPGASSPGAAYRDAFRKAALAKEVGVVGVMSGPSGEVVAINTPVEMQIETPVLQIGEKEKARLDALAASKQPVKLIITGPGGSRNGRNTVARRGTAGPWVIFSTPQCGWSTCGGERGPGIAISRALSAWAMTRDFPVRWLFIATSGHEWIDHGADIFHKNQAPDPKDTAMWFHLGASFGARAYQETPQGLVAADTPNLSRTLMATPDLVSHCEAAFAGHPVIEKPAAADLAKALGEYRLVLEEGYPTSAGF